LTLNHLKRANFDEMHFLKHIGLPKLIFIWYT